MLAAPHRLRTVLFHGGAGRERAETRGDAGRYTPPPHRRTASSRSLLGAFSEPSRNLRVGGVPYPPQQRALRDGVDVLIGTPGRIIDHLNEGALDLSAVRFAVLDEADEMLTMFTAGGVKRRRSQPEV